MHVGLPENVARVLSSTNLIENVFSRVREVARRVRRWHGGQMILRWIAAVYSKLGVYSAKSPAIARSRSWSPCCARVMRRSIASRELIIQSRPPK